MGEDRISTLWKYYAKAAEVFGRDEDNDQAGYSVGWFYSDEEKEKLSDGKNSPLNDLMRAFWGDMEAMERLSWDEPKPSEDDIKPYFLEEKKNQPNKRQTDAIRTALSKPISFIQGPPGTGKTTTILNLLSCIAAQEKTAAIVSTNNSALEAIYSKVDSFNQGENQNRIKESLQKLGRTKVREAVYNKLNENYQSDKRTYHINGKEEAVTRETKLLMPEFLKRYPLIGCTINSLKLCFHKPDNPYNPDEYLYDYVIVDEASQADVVKGLMAMSSGRHLVLVGDAQQLPPVLNKEDIERFEKEFKEKCGSEAPSQIPEALRIKEDRSFLDMCEEIFLESAQDKESRKVFLNEHYRCHPGIIGFCNAVGIYDEPLDIKTIPDPANVSVPIKVLWYEGDYCEPYYPPARKKIKGEDDENRKKLSRQNRKQVEIFMNEEWPDLARCIKDENISVCILSPFNGQIRKLEDALKDWLKKQDDKNIEISKFSQTQEDNESAKDVQDEGLVINPKTMTMTIHKSQGKEFDIVYLLPVEDADWEWPWSQKKRLVNVAVSRAKKELRLIVSTLFMKPKMQEKLTGRAVNPREKHSSGQDEMYIQKLLDYVDEYGSDSDREMGFGFHQTARGSLFDLAPWLRQQEDMQDPYMSLPERCMARALKNMTAFTKGNLIVYRCVRILDIIDSNGGMAEFENFDDEFKKYVENGAEFDFLVCRKDTGQLLMAIEVDGLYHRFDRRRSQLQKQKDADETKNKLAGRIFNAGCYKLNSGEKLCPCETNEANDEDAGSKDFLFLRLPTDGRTCDELNEDSVIAKWLDKMLREAPKKESLGSLYRFAPQSITKFDYDKRAAQLMESLSEAKKFSVLLRDRLIKEHCLFCFDQEDPGKGKKFPTKKGCGKGIVWGWTYHAGNSKEKMKAYGNAYYTPGMEGFIWSRLKETGSFLEGDTPEELMDFLCYRLDAFIWKSVEQGELAQLEDLFVDFREEKPDYSKSEMRKMIFLLRFLPVYAYEYREFGKKLYEEVLCNEMSCRETLDVISIGCGNMVDYWGLAEAFGAIEGSARINYTGIDLEDWSEYCCLKKRESDTVSPVMKQDAVEYLDNLLQMDADLYLFPKSISEFKEKEMPNEPDKPFDKLCRIFAEKEFVKEKVCILTVFATNKQNDGRNDNKKCDRLAAVMEQKGFEITYDSDSLEQDVWELWDSQEREHPPHVWETGRGFSWAEEINKRVKGLLEKAEDNLVKGSFKKEKKKSEKRNPMSRVYGCCRVLVFTKRRD